MMKIPHILTMLLSLTVLGATCGCQLHSHSDSVDTDDTVTAWDSESETGEQRLPVMSIGCEQYHTVPIESVDTANYPADYGALRTLLDSIAEYDWTGILSCPDQADETLQIYFGAESDAVFYNTPTQAEIAEMRDNVEAAGLVLDCDDVAAMNLQVSFTPFGLADGTSVEGDVTLDIRLNGAPSAINPVSGDGSLGISNTQWAAATGYLGVDQAGMPQLRFDFKSAVVSSGLDTDGSILFCTVHDWQKVSQ